MKRTDVYGEYERMVYKWIWNILKGYPRLFKKEELESEAYLIFHKTKRAFDKERGVRFSTLLFSQLKKMLNLATDRIRVKNREREIIKRELPSYTAEFEDEVGIRHTIENRLTEKARILAYYLMSNPSKRGVRKEIVEKYGWTIPQYYKAMNELKIELADFKGM